MLTKAYKWLSAKLLLHKIDAGDHFRDFSAILQLFYREIGPNCPKFILSFVVDPGLYGL